MERMLLLWTTNQKTGKYFTAIWLDAHNNNIRSVGYFVGYGDVTARERLARF